MAIRLGIYIHSKKGTLYRVVANAKHSETLEDMVVYKAQYENPISKIWVRPERMFIEEVEVNGTKVPRFVFVSEE